jgi:hypothetical protein
MSLTSMLLPVTLRTARPYSSGVSNQTRAGSAAAAGVGGVYGTAPGAGAAGLEGVDGVMPGTAGDAPGVVGVPVGAGDIPGGGEVVDPTSPVQELPKHSTDRRQPSFSRPRRARESRATMFVAKVTLSFRQGAAKIAA